MAWRFVRQPNGLLARHSDVVDHFTHINMSVEDAHAYCKEQGMDSFSLPQFSAL